MNWFALLNGIKVAAQKIPWDKVVQHGPTVVEFIEKIKNKFKKSSKPNYESTKASSELDQINKNIAILEYHIKAIQKDYDDKFNNIIDENGRLANAIERSSDQLHAVGESLKIVASRQIVLAILGITAIIISIGALITVIFK